ncbi:helix-turn-helix domain-containing protein [Streptomyces sp. NPDC019990]|uniref:MarR family transcriptional regulator n=1 Tax=Streptomyces sp. NPDC019990 TaxID=3154693 RepID=UPI0033C1EBA6
MTATTGGRPTGCTAPELLCRAERVVFRLNGQLLAMTDALAGPAGLTTAWWRLLTAVLPRPLTVAQAARTAGITRQSARRIADLLVAHGLAAYEPNPAHRRARLLAATDRARTAAASITSGHTELAERLAHALAPHELGTAMAAVSGLSAALELCGTDVAPRPPRTDGRRKRHRRDGCATASEACRE